MLNALSAIEIAADATAGEKLIVGLKVAAIGIAVVFMLLIILIIVIKLFELSAKNKNVAPKPVVAAPVVVSETVNYDATVAAIVGALTVMLSSEAAANPNAKFIVKSIKKFQSGRF